MVSIPLGRSVAIDLDQDDEGQWHWVRWYRWRNEGNLIYGIPMKAPPNDSRGRRFESTDEATDHFRDLLDAELPA